jgi:hypothetical protein
MSTQVSPLQAVQEQFALIELAGKFYIVNRDQIRQLQTSENHISIAFYDDKNGRTKIKRLIEASTFGLDGNEVNKLMNSFMASPHTLLYDGITSDPTPQPANILNLWRPYSIEPIEGDWNILHRFIYEIICDSDKTNYKYLLHYFAHMLQKPEEKSRVAIVFLGGEGIGKGTLYRIIKIIWRYTTRQVHEIEAVVGDWTASALEGSFAVWLDEAMFSGDRKSMDRLKALITEDEVTVKEKHQPNRTMKSVHRIFAASNHEHFAPTGRDDRRLFYLKVSEAWKEKDEEFTPLAEALEDGHTVAAFVYYLLELNISSFKPWRDRPKTNEHAKQKIQSLTGLDRFMYETLQAGEVVNPKYGEGKIWNGSLTISTEDLIHSYKEFDPTAQRHNPISPSKLKPDLKKIFPTAQDARFQERKFGKRGITFDSIEQSRKDFEKHITCEVEWEELPP